MHLYAAFTVMAFLVMYFVTGFLMVRYDWFDQEPSEAIWLKVPEVEIPGDLEGRDLAIYLARQVDIPGKLDDVREEENNLWLARFNQPGATYHLSIDTDQGTYTLQKQDQNAYETITTFHRLVHYGGGFVYDLYMFMMDLSSLSLIIFAITGVYLWLKVLKRKTWGFVFLALGVIYTAIVLLTFHYY